MKYARKILVTGGAGFIGSNYLNKYVLAYPDYFFINVDLLTYAGKLENIEVSNYPNYTFKKADIRDYGALEKIFEVCLPTDIIHFAAETNVDFSIENPSIFIETNIQGTHNLLLLSRKYNINRFHQVSTDEVYGSLSKFDRSFTKKTPVSPNNPYSASKVAADKFVRAYHKTFGLNTVITRCSNNYGPYQDESKLIPKSIIFLLQNKRIPIYAKGENIRDWIYIEDHIDALDLVFHRGVAGEVYNIGGNCEMQNIDIVRKLLAIAGKNESYIEFVSDRKGHDYRYAIDASEIEKELGWRPKIIFDDGIMRTFQFYKNYAK